jgi:hypothetical protein
MLTWPGALKSGGKGRLVVVVGEVEADVAVDVAGGDGDGSGPGRKGRAAGRGGN